ncbi:MAG: hypothetical protein PHG06_15690 [Parabacteroides sp.]|nr:hypothetical protein [Parabacteroides sp.]
MLNLQNKDFRQSSEFSYLLITLLFHIITETCQKSNLSFFDRFRHGGEGVDMFLGAEFPEICPWQDEFDPNCPTEILIDMETVEMYEFNPTAIQTYLPWVNI